MADFSTIISGLRTAAPIIGGFSTLLLASFYFVQHRKLGEQSEILEEQQKIAKLDKTPDLVGPYNMRYDSESESLFFDLSNVGKGPAQYLQAEMRFMLPNSEIEIEDLKLTFSRRDVGFMEPNTIYPTEYGVTFVADMSGLEAKVDLGSGQEIFEAELRDVIGALPAEGVNTPNIRYRIEYSDIFGQSEDPFGREYTISSPTHGFSPQIGLSGHLRHLESVGVGLEHH